VFTSQLLSDRIDQNNNFAKLPTTKCFFGTVKLGDREHFDKEQIGVKEPFPVTKC
jgi:hypothetical protein